MNSPRLLNAVIEVRRVGAGNELRLLHLKPMGRFSALLWKLFPSKIRYGRHPDTAAVANRMRAPVVVDSNEINRWLHEHASLIPELSRSGGLVLVGDRKEQLPVSETAVCV